LTDVHGKCLMRTEDLIKCSPKLYHMAEDGSWPNIQRYGLLSTSAILTLYGYCGTEREKFESEWRPQKTIISCDGLEDAIIRDQIPMPPDVLKRCLLGGMSPKEWYGLINGRIFFWATWKSLEIFLAAKEYKNSPQLVITVDARLLLERYASRVTLSSINSGSTYYDPEKYDRPHTRGRETFKKISDYNAPYIAELVIEEGITNIAEVATSVKRWIAHRINYEKPEFEKLAHIWP